MKNNYKKIFNKKKVLITGHTGFKGSWLALWMHYLGANVMGISKNIPTNPSHFNAIGLKNIINSKKIDIKNDKLLNSSIKKFKPDFIFHLAAQAIVKKSYFNSLETWKSNLLGTINLLESLKLIKKEVIVVLITSDKVYKNLEVKRGYKEQDILGGIDPYGASKSATEIAIKSYINSFFSSKRNKILITTARAGNVIGGGDWSENRLLPDCIRSWSKGKKVIIRNPKSTRPWQHVLDVLNGYIKLAVKVKKNKGLHGEEFNFGPLNKNYQVTEILNNIKKIWPSINWKIIKKKNFFENKLLNLNSNKAKNILEWKTRLNIYSNIKLTIEWYKFYLENKNKKKLLKNSINQIKLFEKIK
tara:strand:+ start:363 stop:1436 length:1074 start_codon:yes stop_codon:yes gene_type:complete